MNKPHFVVPLSDLEWGPKAVSFELGEGWLRQALEGTEATPRGEPGRLEVELTKSGREVMVRGQVSCRLSMPCVVTLDPVDVDVNAEIFLLLSPAGSPRPSPGTKEKPARSKGKNGVSGWSKDPELTSEDAARDTYEGTEIALDSFAREFILLELPMFPKRSDLPSEATAAIPPAPASDDSPRTIDPRLLPLAKLKSRLSQK